MLFTLQRYEFFSKSQQRKKQTIVDEDVVYPTKVRIFQQITTKTRFVPHSVVMLFTLQRYEFFSKSQHGLIGFLTCVGCCLPYKGTNFSANHNIKSKAQAESKDVVYPTKVRIFQQITTDTSAWRVIA